MLPTHGRYDYSNITTRPDYSWPGGRRLAVYLALNIEAFGFGVGKGAAIAPPDQAQSHSIYSWRDYGNRVGIWRLFELLDELGIPAQAQMNTAIYDVAPDIPERLRARGDEILGHGVTLHGGRVRRPDRRSVRRDARAIGPPTAGVPDLAPPLRHRPPVSHPPAAPRAPARPPAPRSRLADAAA